jgi:sorbitol-specific phosphotransferase system component IIBC
MHNGGLIRSVFFPVHALVFALRIEGSYWGLGRVPHWAGWASVLASLATGASVLALLRSFPDVGAVMGPGGVFATSYLVGVAVDAGLLAAFNGPGREE